jgi:hypothetical protein
MALYSSIGQLKSSANSNPLKRFTIEIFFDIFRMSTMYFTRSLIKLLLSTIFFEILFKERSNNDIILTS